VATATPGAAPELSELAKTVMDDAPPIMPVPSDPVKVEGSPYEIEDPTPKDPPGQEPHLQHLPPGAAQQPPPPDPLATPTPATLPPPVAPSAGATAVDGHAPVPPSETGPPPLETREDPALSAEIAAMEQGDEAADKKDPERPYLPSPPAQEQMTGLPPMPSDGPPSFFAGLGYFFKVTGARWKRGRVMGAFKWEIYYLEQDLKKMQEELGRHAWSGRLDSPLTSDQMTNLDALETQRATAQQARQQQAQLIAAEEASFAAVDTDLQSKIDAAQQEVDALKADLSEKSAELKLAKQRLTGEEKELSKLTSERKSKETQAGKAKDPEQQETLKMEADQLGLHIQKAQERKGTAEAAVTALAGPVDELNTNLTAARANKATLDKQLAEAKTELNKKTASFRAEEQKQASEEERLDGEISEALAQMGQTLDEQRPAGAGLDSYYGQLNELRGEIQEKEKSIQLLEAERENYNRKGYKNGVIILASAGGLVLAVTLTLVLLFTFVFTE